MASAAVRNLYIFFRSMIITAAVVTFSIAITIIFAITVAFFAAVTIFRAAINCTAAAAFAVYGFGAIAVRDKGILQSLRCEKGSCSSNAECNKYYPLHYSSFLFEVHG